MLARDRRQSINSSPARTLIEQEAYDVASEGADESFSTDCLRRNLVTQNVDLESLIGQDFKVGTVVLRGTKAWPPCKYVDSLNPNRELLKRFAKSAGIGATVLLSGEIKVGEAIDSWVAYIVGSK